MSRRKPPPPAPLLLPTPALFEKEAPIWPTPMLPPPPRGLDCATDDDGQEEDEGCEGGFDLFARFDGKVSSSEMSEWLSEIAPPPPLPPKDEADGANAVDKLEWLGAALPPPFSSSSSVEMSDTSGESFFWFALKLPIIDILNPPPLPLPLLRPLSETFAAEEGIPPVDCCATLLLYLPCTSPCGLLLLPLLLLLLPLPLPLLLLLPTRYGPGPPRAPLPLLLPLRLLLLPPCPLLQSRGRLVDKRKEPERGRCSVSIHQAT